MDLDWLKVVHESLKDSPVAPLYPHPAGPSNSTLVRLETLVRALRLIPEHKNTDIKNVISRTSEELLRGYNQFADQTLKVSGGRENNSFSSFSK